LWCVILNGALDAAQNDLASRTALERRCLLQATMQVDREGPKKFESSLYSLLQDMPKS
jgi:hypothetical protein